MLECWISPYQCEHRPKTKRNKPPNLRWFYLEWNTFSHYQLLSHHSHVFSDLLAYHGKRLPSSLKSKKLFMLDSTICCGLDPKKAPCPQLNILYKLSTKYHAPHQTASNNNYSSPAPAEQWKSLPQIHLLHILGQPLGNFHLEFHGQDAVFFSVRWLRQRKFAAGF